MAAIPLGAIDLIHDIHDTRQLCPRFRIDGTKIMSRGISRSKQAKKLANTRIRGRVLLFMQNDLLVMQNVQFEFRQVFSHHYLLWGHL